MTATDDVDHLLHLFDRINLSLVSSKRCYSYPLLEGLFFAYCLREQAEVAALFREYRREVHLDRIAQFSKHVGIVLERRRLLAEHLVVFCYQLTFAIAMFVDVCHFVSVDVESHSEIVRPDDIVKVGHSSEILCCEPTV